MIIWYHIKFHHIRSCYIILHHIKSSPLMLCYFLSYFLSIFNYKQLINYIQLLTCLLACLLDSLHTIPYHTIPYHTIPYHTIPYHTIPYHTYKNTRTQEYRNTWYMIYLYVYICNGFRQTILNNPHVFDRSSPTCRGKCRSPDSRSKAPPQPWNRPGKWSVMKKIVPEIVAAQN